MGNFSSARFITFFGKTVATLTDFFDVNRPGPVRGIRSILRGIGQVMFQENAWTGLLFLMGIFWGAYAEGTPQVAWGALTGAVVSTLTGWAMVQKPADGLAGLWGFNGTLVGCAFPTFLGTTWLMWLCLILCAALSTIVRRGFNNVMAPWKVNSLTFPFVFTTWVFLLASRMFAGMPPIGEATPELPGEVVTAFSHGFGNLVTYWLKGISQVFLINDWGTGIFFLVALFICDRWSCLWAAVASAISLAVVCLFHASGSDIADGLYGFSPVLTGIAIGSVFYKTTNWQIAALTVLAIVITVFVQAAMNAFFKPWGLATLTGPFCITTWLFLLPAYKLSNIFSPHSEWRFSEQDFEALRHPEQLKKSNKESKS